MAVKGTIVLLFLLIRVISVSSVADVVFFSQLRQWVDASSSLLCMNRCELAKSHQRELVDGSDPFYTESFLRLKFLTACILIL